MAKDTKQRILNEALVMFAERGYEGTNMRELAQTLGLGKSALYKHYESKEDIWNSLLDVLEEHYSEHINSEPAIPQSLDEFRAMALGMVRFTAHDERIILARKLLQTEQFHDARAKELATEHALLRFKRLFSHVFTGMMEQGLIKQADAGLLALAFSMPIASLIQQCDRAPEEEPEIMAEIEAFVDFFIETYKAPEESA